MTVIRLAIVIPSYDDFNRVSALTSELQQLCLQADQPTVDLIVINDSPWGEIPAGRLRQETRKSNIRTHVLQLKANLGHQAAIALGLAWLLPRLDKYDYVVSMDADGKDDPHDIGFMIQRLQASPHRALACVAWRGLRQEVWLFRVGYEIYKLLSLLLLGTRINFDNFICFRPSAMGILLAHPACLPRLFSVRRPHFYAPDSVCAARPCRLPAGDRSPPCCWSGWRLC